ncbi:DUF4391 domain-containing protein [Pedobacter punctiformis]|uniref:DUF4391 domain-containing protein n=1 Tax=Pedobacter punctiformis TaxID=3004097 RepID=A0ABT4LD49_9SPHI|nr:DUF4391 domain-containing protein [Pedobacter sp. HCMS5-2]MCZ4245842.1 DUF4391 domain-containing protein [Pedobacter sp. HCMS5-2]
MFNLPETTKLNKLIPKNAFDSYTNTKQKRELADNVSRITWLNKLSVDTTNLQSKEILEIQIFNIELKDKVQIKSILNIIDKAIPYPIIFIVRNGKSVYLSTSPKHNNPKNEDLAVIDYTYSTDWFAENDNEFQIELKNDIDWVYKTFCEQFYKVKATVKGLKELVATQKEIDSLNREIEKVKLAIARSKQFNKKVELNLKLKELKDRL